MPLQPTRFPQPTLPEYGIKSFRPYASLSIIPTAVLRGLLARTFVFRLFNRLSIPVVGKCSFSSAKSGTPVEQMFAHSEADRCMIAFSGVERLVRPFRRTNFPGQQNSKHVHHRQLCEPHNRRPQRMHADNRLPKTKLRRQRAWLGRRAPGTLASAPTYWAAATNSPWLGACGTAAAAVVAAMSTNPACAAGSDACTARLGHRAAAGGDRTARSSRPAGRCAELVLEEVEGRGEAAMPSG